MDKMEILQMLQEIILECATRDVGTAFRPFDAIDGDSLSWAISKRIKELEYTGKKNQNKLSDLDISHIIGSENMIRRVSGAIHDENGVVTTQVSYFGRPYEVVLTPKKFD